MASLGKPRDAKGDPQDDFFSPTLTLMMDSNIDQQMHQSLFPFEMGTSVKGKTLLPEGANSFF